MLILKKGICYEENTKDFHFVTLNVSKLNFTDKFNKTFFANS